MVDRKWTYDTYRLIHLHPKTGAEALRQLLSARPEIDYSYERTAR